MIDNSNIELYIFRYKEGLLQPDERQAVEAALDANPDWKALADDYDPSLRLPVVKPLPYPDKKALRQLATPPSPAQRTAKPNIRPLWRRLSAAACLLLAIGVAARLLWPTPMPTPDMRLAGIVADTTTMPSQATDTTIVEAPAVPQPRHSHTPLLAATDPLPVPTPDSPEAQVEPQVQLSDHLITFIDDTDEHPHLPRTTVETDRLITYLDDDDTASPSGMETDADLPAWQYAYQDVRNSVQLMYTEQRTEFINRLLALRDH